MDLMIEVIRREILKYTIEFITTPPDIGDVIESEGGGRSRTIESGEHKGMKNWVEKYLSQKGVSVARGEISKLGYEVDAGCLSKGIFVECGDTEPRKVFEFLRNGFNIGIFQYNSEHIIWFLSTDEFRSFAKDKSYGFL